MWVIPRPWFLLRLVIEGTVMTMTLMIGLAGNDGANDNTKMEFSLGHLQVVHVFDSFDVSNEQVGMNFNSSSRLRKLSLILFEIQISHYP